MSINATPNIYSQNGLLTNNIGFVTTGTVVTSNGADYSTIISAPTFYFNDGRQHYLSGAPKREAKINAGLYFRYVKKKFTKLQKQELEARLKKLLHLQLQAEITDQQGLLESVEAMLLVAAREQVLLIKKLDRFVMKEHIDKFLQKTDNVYQKPLEQFPRPIPADVQKKIVSARELKVFDTFVVVYTDYTSEPVKKSSADKIREKDPIVFGTMTGAPDRLYYIADWVDEYCDLTLDKLVERYKPEDGTALVQHVEDLKKNRNALDNLTRRVHGRLEKLNQTTRENWRQQERDAATERAKELADAVAIATKGTEAYKAPVVKKPWWKRIF